MMKTLHELAFDVLEKTARRGVFVRQTYHRQHMPKGCWNCFYRKQDYDRISRCERTGRINDDQDVLIVDTNGVCELWKEIDDD